MRAGHRRAVRPLGLEVRAGLHTGEVERADGKVAGSPSTSARGSRRRRAPAKCSLRAVTTWSRDRVSSSRIAARPRSKASRASGGCSASCGADQPVRGTISVGRPGSFRTTRDPPCGRSRSLTSQGTAWSVPKSRDPTSAALPAVQRKRSSRAHAPRPGPGPCRHRTRGRRPGRRAEARRPGHRPPPEPTDGLFPTLCCPRPRLDPDDLRRAIEACVDSREGRLSLVRPRATSLDREASPGA